MAKMRSQSSIQRVESKMIKETSAGDGLDEAKNQSYNLSSRKIRHSPSNQSPAVSGHSSFKRRADGSSRKEPQFDFARDQFNDYLGVLQKHKDIMSNYKEVKRLEKEKAAAKEGKNERAFIAAEIEARTSRDV